MLLATCIKAVWRTDTALRLQDSGRAVQPDGRHPTLNPADRSALGVALRLARALPGVPTDHEVRALTVGPAAWEGLLRDALAWGATGVLRLWHPDWPESRSLEVDGSAESTRLHAQAAAAALRPLAPALVLVGQSSGDSRHGCFGALLARELGAAYAHRVTAVEPLAAGWRVVAELERGYAQRMDLPAPAVVSIPAHLPGPPDAALPALLHSRKLPIPVTTVESAVAARAATTLRAPVPRVKRYTIPAANLSAEERIQAMVTLPSGSGGAVLGAEQGVDQHVDAVLALLTSRGYVKA